MNNSIFWTMKIKLVFQIDSFNVNIFNFYSISIRNFEKFYIFFLKIVV